MVGVVIPFSVTLQLQDDVNKVDLADNDDFFL